MTAASTAPSTLRPDRLVLASGSPDDRDLLAGLGLRFEIRPADIDEAHPDFEPGPMYVGRLARAKAATVVRAGEVVIAADTTVDLDGELLGKPADADSARALLRRLSGRTHQVHTGVCVHWATGSTPEIRSDVVTTSVTFADLPVAWIDWYVGTGEPLDKAGGYGMQGAAALFVARIDGSPTNVIGLPLDTVAALVSEIGLELFAFAAAPG